MPRPRHRDPWIQDIIDRVPEPGTSPFEHLRHTVAMFAETDGDEVVVLASDGIYPEGRTGLTWTDLRLVSEYMELIEEHGRPNHPAFGR